MNKGSHFTAVSLHGRSAEHSLHIMFFAVLPAGCFLVTD